MTETFLKIRTVIESNHADEDKYVSLVKEIRGLLAGKFAGKRVDTKRTLTYIGQAHPDWVVNFYHIAAMTYMRVWGGNSGYTMDNHFRVFLGYDNEVNAFDLNKFDEHNNIAIIERRQEEREAFLDDTAKMQTVADAMDTFVEARANIVNSLRGLPDSYGLEEIIKLKGDR